MSAGSQQPKTLRKVGRHLQAARTILAAVTKDAERPVSEAHVISAVAHLELCLGFYLLELNPSCQVQTLPMLTESWLNEALHLRDSDQVNTAANEFLSRMSRPDDMGVFFLWLKVIRDVEQVESKIEGDLFTLDEREESFIFSSREPSVLPEREDLQGFIATLTEMIGRHRACAEEY